MVRVPEVAPEFSARAHSGPCKPDHASVGDVSCSSPPADRVLIRFCFHLHSLTIFLFRTFLQLHIHSFFFLRQYPASPLLDPARTLFPCRNLDFRPFQNLSEPNHTKENNHNFSHNALLFRSRREHPRSGCFGPKLPGL